VEITAIKSAIVSEIESKGAEIKALSRRIHDNPELGFQETRAAAWISEYLEKEGFAVERGICQFPTAFKASYGQGQPVIAFLAEYDALPQLGHACGHNLISAAAVGALIGARRAAQTLGGTVQLIGTPAEELFAGKEIMVQRGAFNHLDAALMVHPGNQDFAAILTLACQRLDIEFFGKAAHAAGEPQAGINALEATLQSFNAINGLRQHFPPRGMVHGVITDGGAAANIVPEHSAANFIVRAADLKTMETLKQKILHCFAGAATATGTRLEYKWEEPAYAPVINNPTICDLYCDNIRHLGRSIFREDPNSSFGSTDFGNVSQIVPGMHATVKVAEKGIAVHSRQFAEAAISDYGLQSMLQAAQGLAMTAADLLADPRLVQKMQSEFAARE
jgi:amidohydrolase